MNKIESLYSEIEEFKDWKEQLYFLDDEDIDEEEINDEQTFDSLTDEALTHIKELNLLKKTMSQMQQKQAGKLIQYLLKAMENEDKDRLQVLNEEVIDFIINFKL